MKIRKLSIVIPAYNERETISELIEIIQRVDLGPVAKEIIVVDDGSKDGTREILAKIPGIRYVFHEKNLGKGGAVKTGFLHATGEAVIIQDADLEYDPEDYAAMITPLSEGRSEAVIGVRIQPARDQRRHKPMYWLSWLGNKSITWTTNLLFNNNSKEYEGCYKVFSRQLLDTIEVETNGFAFDNELICKILKKGHKTVDVPIHYRPRNYEEGKKITWKDGFRILATIVKVRFS